MAEFESLFANYDRLVIFDTETTGLDYANDEIIEFAAVVVEQRDGKAEIVREYDELIALSPGKEVPEMIQNLTGITNKDLELDGIAKEVVCADIDELFNGTSTKTLLLAYNAHFDLSFLFHLLHKNGNAAILKGKDKLDLLTVYKDRRPYPHKLCNAIEAYGLTGEVVNSHRAVDDVIATVAVMKAMEAEKDDMHRYINLFGVNPKYGISGAPIRSVTYKAQPYNTVCPLYEVE
jgi:DNA polymerase-3 subunit epsilon